MISSKEAPRTAWPAPGRKPLSLPAKQALQALSVMNATGNMHEESSNTLAGSAEAASLAEGQSAHDDTSLPVFANAGNRALGSEIRSLHKQLQVTDEELLDNTDTITVLLEHLGKAKRDVRLASERLADSSNKFCTDEHLYQLSLRQLVGIHWLL